MKKNLLIIVGGIIILSLFSINAGAQEWGKINPKMTHILVDTLLFRATEITLEPGEKSDLHTHPAHFFYALTDGKMTVHYQDGKNETYELKPGFAAASDPEGPHITENVGNTTIKFLLVELKEHPYINSKKAK